jgi:hypothetical protein
MRLAHFTHIFYLAGIVREGIAKGEVPLSPVHVINFPWFTSDFTQDAQLDWTSLFPGKTSLRLEVEFREDDERLVLWRDYAKRLRLRDDWYRDLTGPHLNRNERSWRVYRGVVPFTWITGAYFQPLRERLTPDTLREAAELIAPLNIQGRSVLPCQHLTEAEALTMSHDERMAGYSEPVRAALADVLNHSGPMRVFVPPPAHTFLDYVRGAIESYRTVVLRQFTLN